MIMYIKLDYYSDVCDKTIKIKTKRKHLKSSIHNEVENCMRRRNTIKNPDFFDKDDTFYKIINNPVKKLDLFLVKYDLT